jgi:hypothetical protein
MILVAVALAIAAFLAVFLAAPVASVFHAAFASGAGGFTLAHFESFLQISLMRESFWNSLWVAGLSVVFASLIAVPLAYFTVRFRFRGALLIQTLGVLPLIMPPFVGAVAMQLLFGRSGSVNLLLNDAFGVAIPFMDGLNGVSSSRACTTSRSSSSTSSSRCATSTARWRNRRRTSAPPAGGCSGESSFPSPCPAKSPARRSSSSRCSTTSARRSSSARPTCSPRRPTCASPRSASRTRSAT